MSGPVRSRQVVEQVARRSAEVVEALRRLDLEELRGPSSLPGWSRLTIACHLRYGAETLSRITAAALACVPVAFYPDGRDEQRPATLQPRPDESAHEVVESLAAHADHLHGVWRSLGEEEWRLAVVEPGDRVDLGSIDLAGHALLRLTEVEVHGTDLDLGLDDWSDTFVTAALPFRLDRLNGRRVDVGRHATWLVAPTDGPPVLVSVDGGVATSTPAPPDAAATATIAGSGRDLLALLLGRPLRQPLEHHGDVELGRAFGSAFPGP